MEYESSLKELIASHPGEKANRSVQEVLKATEEDYNHHSGITWGLILNGELIGTCGYYRGFDNQIGEIGYVLKKEYRNQGYMSECIPEILRFGFESLNLSIIKAITDENNEPSVKLLSAFGFDSTDEIEDGFRKYILHKNTFIHNHES